MTRTFAAIIAGFCYTSATLADPPSTLKTFPMQKSEIVDVSTINPLGYSVKNAGSRSLLTLGFDLLGCADQLGDMQYLVQETDDGRFVVHVAAQNIHTEASTRIRCFTSPKATRKIALPAGVVKDDVELRELKVAKGGYRKKLPISPRPPMTCMAHWTGWSYNATTGTCMQLSASGCSNPFPFETLEACQETYGLPADEPNSL